jgi:hypothetical protein
VAVNIPGRIGSVLLPIALLLACAACGEAAISTTAATATGATGSAVSDAATTTSVISRAAVSTTAATAAVSSAAPTTTGQVSTSTTSDTAPPGAALQAQGETTSVGQEAQVGDWDVEVVSVTWNADSVVANHSEFNDPPGDGYQYLLVKIRAVRTGLGTGSFSGDVDCTFLGSDGSLFETAPQDIPEAMGDADPCDEGSAVTGNVVFQVSSDLVSGGRLVMEPSSSSAGSQAVFVLE